MAAHEWTYSETTVDVMRSSSFYERLGPAKSQPSKHKTFCITFAQRRPNVFDVGPTFYKYYTNVLCLLRTHDKVCGGPGTLFRCGIRMFIPNLYLHLQ